MKVKLHIVRNVRYHRILFSTLLDWDGQKAAKPLNRQGAWGFETKEEPFKNSPVAFHVFRCRIFGLQIVIRTEHIILTTYVVISCESKR